MLMCRNSLEICGNGVVCLQNPAIMWKTVCCNHGNFYVFTAVDESHVSVWQELWSDDSLADPWNKLWSRNSNFKVKLRFLIGTLRAGQAAVRKVRQSHIPLLLLDCCKGQNRLQFTRSKSFPSLHCEEAGGRGNWRLNKNNKSAYIYIWKLFISRSSEHQVSRLHPL